MQSANDIDLIPQTDLETSPETRSAKIFDQIARLNHAQYLTLSALRRIVTGYVSYPMIRREFEVACGADGHQVFELLRAVIDCLARGARRPLRVGQPCFNRVTSDEQQILILIAVAQGHALTRFEAHLCWLSRAEGQYGLTMTVKAFAEAMGRHGEWFPIPTLCSRPPEAPTTTYELRSL